MSDLDDRLAMFSQMVENMNPKVKAVLDACRAGTMSMDQALVEMLNLTATGALNETAVKQAALEVFQPSALWKPKEGPPLVYQETGLPQVNPLVQAAIAERLQFDGDIPELRSGPLPVGVEPAVPVLTDLRNPVAIGKQMAQAASEVQLQLEEHSLETSLAPITGYRAGVEAEPRQALEVSGSTLLETSKEEERRLAWKVFSSTQGRKSVRGVLVDMLLKGLRDTGLDVQEVPNKPPNPEIQSEWVMGLMGGEGAMQPHFAFVDIAAGALLQKLRRQIPEGSKKWGLFVEPINTVDIRQVGWLASMVQG